MQHVRLCCLDAAQQRHVGLEDRCACRAACQSFDLRMQFVGQRPFGAERQGGKKYGGSRVGSAGSGSCRRARRKT